MVGASACLRSVVSRRRPGGRAAGGSSDRCGSGGGRPLCGGGAERLAGCLLGVLMDIEAPARVDRFPALAGLCGAVAAPGGALLDDVAVDLPVAVRAPVAHVHRAGKVVRDAVVCAPVSGVERDVDVVAAVRASV